MKKNPSRPGRSAAWTEISLLQLTLGLPERLPAQPPSELRITEKISKPIRCRVAAVLPAADAYNFLRALHGQNRPGLSAGGRQINLGRIILTRLIHLQHQTTGEILMEHDRESYAEAEESSGLGGAIRFQAPVDMELLRIPLLVVLGQAEISARHLFELSTGQRIEFEFDPNLPVRLVIGGETIARGRLVRRGSALAVEVVSPHDTGEAASAGPDKISSQEVNSFEISENL